MQPSVFADELIAEGEIKGRTNTLFETLDERFGPLPEEVRLAVFSASLSDLRAWPRLAAKSSSLEEFKRAVGL